MTLQSITTWMVFAGAVPSLVFVVLYGVTSPWWKSEGGRHLMSFAGVMSLLFVWGILGVLWPGHTGREILTLVLAVSLNLVLWWRLATLVYLHFGLIRRRLDVRPKDHAADREGGT